MDRNKSCRNSTYIACLGQIREMPFEPKKQTKNKVSGVLFCLEGTSYFRFFFISSIWKGVKSALKKKRCVLDYYAL